MTPRGRTNQLLYQAELLLDMPAGDDEHAPARRMAREEGALALLGLALNAALRELTEHAALANHDWRDLLGAEGESVAELQRLRALRADPQSWLGQLCAQLEALESAEGAARREVDASLIAIADRRPLGEELQAGIRAFKAELARLRETSVEW